MSMRLRLMLCAGLIFILTVGCSNSDTNNQNTDTNSPTTPTGFTVTARDSSLSLSWAANSESDLDHYDIYSGTREADLRLTKQVDSSETSTTLEGLSNGTVYYAAISAVDSSGNKSALSVVRSATPTASTGGSFTPTNFTVVAGDGEIQVSWSSARDDIREYVVYWGTNSSALYQSERVDQNSRSVTITGLSNGTTYFVAVSAVDTSGNESDRTAVATSTPLDSNTQPPATPEAIVVVPGDSKATIRWAANIEPDLAGYIVYYGTTRESANQSEQVAANITAKEIRGLTNGTAYYVAVSAVDVSGKESIKTESQPVTPVKPDITAPAIVRTTPEDSAEVTEVITITFTEAMTAGSVQVTISPNVEIDSRTWSTDATVLTLDSKQSLEYDTRYEVRVVGTDKAGNSLSGTTTFSFTTRSLPDTISPFVTTTSPNSGASDIPASVNISLAFSEPMDRASVEGAFSVSPPVACAFSWTSEDRLMTCDPSEDLASEAQFTVELTTEAEDVAGNSLENALNFLFTTANAPDTTAPRVLGSSPATDERGVALNATITVTFSESMDRKSAEEAFTITEPSGLNRQGIFIWNDEGTEMTFKPDRYYEFYYGDAVEWRVQNTAKDQAGNDLESSYLSNFRVVQLSYITLYSEESLDGHVQSDGYVNVYSSTTEVGDDYNNVSKRAFFTFDLSQLPNDVTKVNSAYLSAYPVGRIGSPETELTTPDQPDVFLESVDYGNTLDFNDFDKARTNFCVGNADCSPVVSMNTYYYDDYSNSIYSQDMTDLVEYELENDATGNIRVQVRLQFSQYQSVDYNDDYLYFYTDHQQDTYNRPRLELSYEHP
jgi:chitodextrinase